MLKKCEQVTNIKGVLSYVHESNVAVKSLLVFKFQFLTLYCTQNEAKTLID